MHFVQTPIFKAVATIRVDSRQLFLEMSGDELTPIFNLGGL